MGNIQLPYAKAPFSKRKHYLYPIEYSISYTIAGSRKVLIYESKAIYTISYSKRMLMSKSL